MNDAVNKCSLVVEFFFSSRRRHTRWTGDWSSDVCSSDLCFLLISSNIRRKHWDSVWPGFFWSVARSEERRVGKSVDLGGGRTIEKKKVERWRRQCRHAIR